MSLSSSLQLASNSLRANEIGLQVVSQNIANSNTDGYIRESVLLTAAPTQRVGGLLLGMGVQVSAVVQQLDAFLEERLRSSVSDLSGSEAIESAYMQLESVLGELGDTDLSTSLNDFFSSISEILNSPESTSVRNLAVLQGGTLTDEIQRMAAQVVELRNDLNEQVETMADQINSLTEQISVLNVRIAELEGGSTSSSDAVGLRDQRLMALESLAELVNIKVSEQKSGGVAVYVGGEYLVFEGTARQVELVHASDRGLAAASIQICETASPLKATSGEMQGLTYARDEVLGTFLDSLNDFAAALINEFNKLFSSGQGLEGFTELTGTYHADDPKAALNQAGLSFTPSNGSFQILVYNEKTGLTRTSQITVDLNGQGKEMTLEDLETALKKVDGVSAEITSTRALKISATGANEQISFADDTSGILAALGLNTFFTGTSALDIGVNDYVEANSSLFAASSGGIAADTATAVELANFIDRPLVSRNGSTMSFLYDKMVSEVTQGSAVSQAVAEGDRVYEASLRGQKSAVSGVNLDEEAISMLAYQRAYQASARLIAAVNELFEILVSI